MTVRQFQQATKCPRARVLERRIFRAAAVGREAAARREAGSRPASSLSDGTMPGISARRAGARAPARRRAAAPTRAARAYRGAAARANNASTDASSTLRPAYMTTTRCAISATTPRSWVIRMIAAPSLCLQLAHQIEDLRLDRDVERGRRLVGDQQLRVAGERHRDHHALAHAARELVRVLAGRAAPARGCARAQHLDGARAAPRSRSGPGAAPGFRRSAGRWSAPD